MEVLIGESCRKFLSGAIGDGPGPQQRQKKRKGTERIGEALPEKGYMLVIVRLCCIMVRVVKPKVVQSVA